MFRKFFIGFSAFMTVLAVALTVSAFQGAGMYARTWSAQYQRVTTNTAYTSSATLTTPTGFSAATLRAGTTYRIRGHLYTTATSNGGLKITLTAVTLTATSILGEGYAFVDGGISSPGQFTTITNLYGVDAAATDYFFDAVLVVNAGGTLAVQTAQHTSHMDTTTVLAGSWVEFQEVP